MPGQHSKDRWIDESELQRLRDRDAEKAAEQGAKIMAQRQDNEARRREQQRQEQQSRAYANKVANQLHSSSGGTGTSLTQKQIDAYKEKGITLGDDEWWHCELCPSKKLVEGMIDEHLRSIQHTKREGYMSTDGNATEKDLVKLGYPARRFTTISDDGSFKCTLCSKMGWGVDGILAHFESKEHCRRIKWEPPVTAEELAKDREDQVALDVTQVQYAGREASAGQATATGTAHGGHDLSQIPPSDRHYITVDPEGWLICTLCRDKKFSDTSHLVDSHLESKEHKRKKALWSPEEVADQAGQIDPGARSTDNWASSEMPPCRPIESGSAFAPMAQDYQRRDKAPRVPVRYGATAPVQPLPHTMTDVTVTAQSMPLKSGHTALAQNGIGIIDELADGADRPLTAAEFATTHRTWDWDGVAYYQLFVDSKNSLWYVRRDELYQEGTELTYKVTQASKDEILAKVADQWKEWWVDAPMMPLSVTEPGVWEEVRELVLKGTPE
jgi:hypothetical protein